MSDIKTRHIQMIEQEIAQHRAAIADLEGLLAAIQSYQPGAVEPDPRLKPPSAKSTSPKRRSRNMRTSTARSKVGQVQAPVTYVSLTEDALREAGGPMKMKDILAKVLPQRPGAGKFAESAARNAITKAMDAGRTLITRAGPKGSGLLTLKDGT
jgi:hypothetical protein